jgi:hypothetical protein
VKTNKEKNIFQMEKSGSISAALRGCQNKNTNLVALLLPGKTRAAVLARIFFHFLVESWMDLSVPTAG